MHVGVEEAVAQRVAEERLHDDGGEALRIVAGRDERLAVAERVPSTHSVTSTSRPVSSQSTRGTRKSVFAGDVLRHLRIGGGLQPQVHLQDDAARRISTTATGRSRRVRADRCARRSGRRRRRSEVARRSAARMPGRSTFTATARRPPASAPPCGPARSRRRRRRGRKLSKTVSIGLPMDASTALRAASCGKGGQIVLQLGEVCRRVGADDVAAGSPGTGRA